MEQEERKINIDNIFLYLSGLQSRFLYLYCLCNNLLLKMSDDKNFDPWSNPQPQKKKPKSPFPPEGGNGGNKKVDPEMEEMLRRFQERTKKMFGGDGGNNNNIIIIGAALVFTLWLVFGSVFFVSSGERAVVQRFGDYNRTVESGLNFKFPPPFEVKQILNVEIPNLIQIGEGTQKNLMVTGDENIVDVEFVVRWNIKKAEDFVFNVSDQEKTVKNAAESAMREVIGAKPMSLAGEDKSRAKTAQEVQERMQAMLDNYTSGIRIIGVELKKIDVPEEVIDAQIDVQNAKTEQEKVKNQAEAYRNDILPRAGGDAAKMQEDAQAYKQSVVTRAKGEASRFMAVYEQYAKAKDVTKSRIYLDTMQDVLGKMDKTIIDGSTHTIPYLPLNNLRPAAGKETPNAQ